MTLRVIGAGLPRTGTRSLRAALERLLGGECYHMSLVFEREQVDVPAWQAAVDGRYVDWEAVFVGCTAAVDWPASAFWAELADAYPDALVVLTTRDNPEQWWRSADATVWPVMRSAPTVDNAGWFRMIEGVRDRVFGPGWDDSAEAMASYEQYNAGVRASCPPERLLDFKASDGWGPLCERLGVPIPDEEFPRMNTKEEWAANAERDNAGEEEPATP